MNILFATCYTGDKRYFELTRDAVKSLIKSCNQSRLDGLLDDFKISIVNNGSKYKFERDDFCYDFEYAVCWKNLNPPQSFRNKAVHSISLSKSQISIVNNDKNEGFARGMNQSFKNCYQNYDVIVIFNNDIYFKDQSWLSEMILEHRKNLVQVQNEGDGFYKVLVPMNTYSSCPEQLSDCADKSVRCIDVKRAPAILWFIPRNIIEYINQTYQIPLFHPEFEKGWAEDDLACMMISKKYERPFRVVSSSFVVHYGSLTQANEECVIDKNYVHENWALLIKLCKEYGFNGPD